MNSRREFLFLMAGAAVKPPFFGDKEPVPDVLDHILLGCGDLERGIAFVNERTGVRATFGGVHPGRGTQNALLSLGTRRYLEIIAPDPKQDVAVVENGLASKLKPLAEPRLVTWAAHPENLAVFAEKLAKAGVEVAGPTAGARKRPDGKTLHWNTVNLQDDLNGLLPFFIEWRADSVHPSADAPKGCTLEKFWVESPEPEEFAKKFRTIGIEIEVSRGEKTLLRARIKGPNGEMEATS